MGKTQLIRHVYRQKQICESYYAFYIDIYSTTSLREFILLFAKEIYGTLVPAGRKVLDAFIGTLKSLYGGFGYDAMTGLPSFDIKLGDIRTPELTLSEIFRFLEKADKPCIYTIDEFQQIGYYKEKNASEITSVSFIKKHSLQSPSAVQNAVRNLLKIQMITYQIEGKTKIYSISDRFMQIWINDKY